MIPTPWEAAVLALGAFRIVRLIGWDDLPPIENLRNRITGMTVYNNSTDSGRHYRYRRPVLAHFLGCAFCQGFWVTAGVYGLWLLEPYWTLRIATLFALAAVVGLIAKNWDP